MINETRLNEILRYYSQFNEKAIAFKKLLMNNKLALSTDNATLLFNFKMNQFIDLLKVDKGLKMRYDMLKSDEAKKDLINSTINLAGYSIVNELSVAITSLNIELDKANMHFRFDKHFAIPNLQTLVTHELDIMKCLNSRLLTWSDKQIRDREIIEQFYNQLAIVKSILNSNSPNSELVRDIDGYFVNNVIDEMKLWHRFEDITKRKQVDEEQERKRLDKYNSPAEIERRSKQAVIDAENSRKFKLEQQQQQIRYQERQTWYDSLAPKQG